VIGYLDILSRWEYRHEVSLAVWAKSNAWVLLLGIYIHTCEVRSEVYSFCDGGREFLGQLLTVSYGSSTLPANFCVGKLTIVVVRVQRPPPKQYYYPFTGLLIDEYHPRLAMVIYNYLTAFSALATSLFTSLL
jgi:hypothetical protein